MQIAKNDFTIKNMKTREQVTLAKDAIAGYITQEMKERWERSEI